MIARKFQFALIPAVMLAMVACNLSDQAHAPEKPASPAEPSEATAAVDTSLEGVDIDSATMDSLMRVSEALGNAGLAVEKLDSATLDTLIRLSGTSDSAIESRASESAAGPIAAKTSAASKPCQYGIYKAGGGTCTNPYPDWGLRGVVYVSPLIGKASLNGVPSIRYESICNEGQIQKFGVQVTVYPSGKPIDLEKSHVSSIFHTCGVPVNALGPFYWVPRYGYLNVPPVPFYKSSRQWDGLVVGIRARSGDWIDALGPIILKPGGRLSVAAPKGKLNGGTPKAMLCPKHYFVAGFVGYYNRDHNHGLTGLKMVCKDFRGPMRKSASTGT